MQGGNGIDNVEIDEIIMFPILRQIPLGLRPDYGAEFERVWFDDLDGNLSLTGKQSMTT